MTKALGWTFVFITSLLIWFVIISGIKSCNKPVMADEIDLDRWADAIFKAEGGYKADYLYGIRSISYETESQARKYCKNTVYNTLVKYRDPRCKDGESDIDCLARRYCPQNSDTDNGTCQYWKKNVQYFLAQE